MYREAAALACPRFPASFTYSPPGRHKSPAKRKSPHSHSGAAAKEGTSICNGQKAEANDCT